MIDNPLTNILIRPNVISKYGINDILSHARRSNKNDLKIFDSEMTNRTGKLEWRVDKNIRDTQSIDFGPLHPNIRELFDKTVSKIINPFYKFEISESEIPQLLSYSVGGHYHPHVDGESLWHSPKKELIWKKSIDRDLSIVFFLNDNFEGGDFVFPELRVRIRPEPGMLVCFPSNHHYLHGVEPVTKGTRYSIVSWARVNGFETVEQQNKRLSSQYGIAINN